MPAKQNDPIQHDPRVFCFVCAVDEKEFENTVTKLVGRMQEQYRQMFVSDENILRLHHGNVWINSATTDDSDSSMHTIAAEYTIPFKGLAENDLGLIAGTILPLTKAMQQQFAQNMYGVIGEAAEKVGNVVDAKASGSISLSMLEALRKIEFGVDRDGNISMPQMHVGPELFERIRDEIDNVLPEITEEIERVKAEKIKSALEREAERKAKFKRKPA